MKKIIFLFILFEVFGVSIMAQDFEPNNVYPAGEDDTFLNIRNHSSAAAKVYLSREGKVAVIALAAKETKRLRFPQGDYLVAFSPIGKKLFGFETIEKRIVGGAVFHLAATFNEEEVIMIGDSTIQWDSRPSNGMFILIVMVVLIGLMFFWGGQ